MPTEKQITNMVRHNFPAKAKVPCLYFDCDASAFLEMLEKSLSEYTDSNEVLVATKLSYEGKVGRQDLFIIIASKAELLARGFQDVMLQLLGLDESETDILSFLKKQWAKDEGCYSLFFYWTIQPTFIHISDRAVAPAFRKQGIMKGLSLDLLSVLGAEISADLFVTAISIHPATYLFFSPHDKALKHYEQGELQDMRLGFLLELHGRSCGKVEQLSLASFALVATLFSKAGGQKIAVASLAHDGADLPVGTGAGIGLGESEDSVKPCDAAKR